MRDFLDFFRNIQTFYVDATVTKSTIWHVIFFKMLFFSLKCFISFFFHFFLFVIVLVGRILRMQLRHFYIVATSRIITSSICIWALSSACKQVQLQERSLHILLEVRLARRRGASFPTVSFSRIMRRV